jgi:NADPH:quinone reductase-like Zn-dependent oxidoreductase
MSVDLPKAETEMSDQNPSSGSMAAVIQDSYGTGASLELRQVEIPVPVDGEVLVRVHASSLNALDFHLGTGTPSFVRLQMGLFKPKRKTPGADVAGDIVAVGAGDITFQIGDRVIGEVDGGGFAEYVATKAGNLVSLPNDVSFDSAGALPVAGLTALQALQEHGHVERGDTVLVNGASGGVGTFAVQIARALGAEVTAVCSTRNVDQARLLGAGTVFDYSKDDFVKAGGRYDVIVDLVGNRSPRDIASVLTGDGRYVYVGGPKGSTFRWILHVLKSKFFFRGRTQTMTMFTAAMNQDDMSQLVRMVQSGEVKPAIEARYPLVEAAEAYDNFCGGHSRGKAVIEIR